MTTFFAADLHLMPGDRPAQNRALEALLRRPAPGEALYLLGDTFHCWFERGGRVVGDYDQVLARLGEAVGRGVGLHVLPGNRDFPAGPELTARTGIRCEPESCVVALGTLRVLASHGDRYCTCDYQYQALRRLLLGPVGRWFRCHLPWAVARPIVSFVQTRPKLPLMHTPLGRLDIQTAPVEAALARHAADVAICGHRHLEEVRILSPQRGRARTLYVLPPWLHRHRFLTWRGAGEGFVFVDAAV